MKLWVALGLWLAAMTPAVVLSLHATSILPIVMETVPLTTFTPLQGSAYVAPLDTVRYPRSENPSEVVCENGVPVRYPSMPGWGVVATQGEGRFHISEGAVYMSATDNTDPRANGRTYTVVRPKPVTRKLFLTVWAIALIVTIGVGIWCWRPIVRFIAHPPFAFVGALLFALVAANRAWLFTDYPLVAIHPDSGSYFAAADQIGSGTLPNFGNRPPVYPIFIRTAFAIYDRAIFLSFCQMLLAFLGGLSLVYGAYRWKPVLAWPAVFVVALYSFSVATMEHDSAMLSESVYASFLMLSFGPLIVALRDGHRGWLAWSSTSMALAILTRPAGMFLVVSYLLVVAWVVWRRERRMAIAAFVIPFPVLLLAMSVYNMTVVRAFAPTTWGEANLAVATFLYWEQDPSYPPEVNHDIERIRAIIAKRYEITKLDRSLLDRSWDPDALAPIFVQSFNAAALDIAMPMGGNYETSGRQWIRRIAIDSIRKHPVYYSKFLFSMLYLYFKPYQDFDFRAYLLNRAWLFYVARQFSPERGNAFMVKLGKEFASGQPPANVIITDTNPDSPIDLSSRILLPSTRGWRVYHLTHVVRRVLTYYWVWSISVFVGLISSFLVLLLTRFRHDGAFVLFIVTVSALGAALVVSMVEYSQPRYSYPMEWTYGMSAVLLPLLFIKSRPPAPQP